MKGLSASGLLKVWEEGSVQSPSGRALAMLAAACPDVSPEVLARLPIGQRDGQLLTLRERTFGSEFVCLAACPRCAGCLEFAFRADEMRVRPATEPAENLSISVGGYEVRFRLPNSLDLEAIAASSNPDTARRVLLSRCLEKAQQNNRGEDCNHLPPQVIQAVVDEMGKADPQADLRFDLSCPSCGHAWQETFDIGSFFWKEIHAWACRLLRDVHTLALAYGWGEADILALSPWRRQFYLERIGG